MKMNTKRSLLTSLCCFLLAACTVEVEQGGASGSGQITLRPGEMEASIRLSGLGGGGGVPVSRAATDAVVLPGENEVKELLVYCFVNIRQDGTVFSEEEPTMLDSFEASTLERVYHYKEGAADNDLLLTSDGDGYRVTFGVPRDEYHRYFKLVANGGAVPADVVAVSIKDSGTGALADRSTATRFVSVGCPQFFPAGGMGGTPLSLTPIACPLCMMGTGYWRQELTGGSYQEKNCFTAEKLAQGVRVDLARQAARFDIDNPAASGFELRSVKVSDIGEWKFNEEGREQISTRGYYPDLPVENAEFLPAVFYLPQLQYWGGTGNDGGTLRIELAGVLYGVETTLVITDGRSWFKPNTRYLITIKNSAGNAVASLRAVPWLDDGSGIEGDVFGKLNAGVTVALNADMPEAGSIAEIDADNRVIHFSRLSGSRGRAATDLLPLITFTGAAGDANPIGVIMPADAPLFSMGTASTATGTYVVPLRLAKSDAASGKQLMESFRAPETYKISLVTHRTDAATGAKTQQVDEYTLKVDYLLPSLLNTVLGDAAGAAQYFPPVTITPPDDTWRVDEVNHKITLPVFPYSGSMPFVLEDAGFASGWTEQAGWLEWQRKIMMGGGQSQNFLLMSDNFHSSVPRTGSLTLRCWNSATNRLETTVYTLEQEAGGGDVTKLTSAGYEVDCSQTANSGTVTGISCSGNTLSIADNGGVANPDGYCVSIRSKDRYPILVEIVQGAAWMKLVPCSRRMGGTSGGDANDADAGHYMMGLYIDANSASSARTGRINISYHDGSGGLKTETLTVSQGKNSGAVGTWSGFS